MPKTKTNIKNLPEGPTYWTEFGYSQSYPWVEVKRTPSGKTVTLAKVNVNPDPEWKEKKEFIPGGFVGHCPNQHEQTWLYAGVDENRTVRIFKNKDGKYRLRGGAVFHENVAREFYDYNF